MDPTPSKLPIQNSESTSVLEHSNIVKKFMVQKDIPSWFRGLSGFQVAAAESLFNCLRDDTQQETCFRVQGAISLIGVTPPISSENMKLVMKLSRGNDLAFLWFLMDLFYKDEVDPRYEYNVNQQIIMSSIAHLDMITTLRELDRILPQQPEKVPIKSKVSPKRYGPKRKYKLPYFEPMLEPKLRKTRKCIRHSHGPTKFGMYERYKDEKYAVCNEQNRWYSSYKLSQSKRVVKGIISEEIQKVVQGEFSDIFNATILCVRHQAEAKREECRENERKVQAKELCLNHFDPKLRKREASKVEFRKRVELIIGAQRGEGQPKGEQSNGSMEDQVDKNYVKGIGAQRGEGQPKGEQSKGSMEDQIDENYVKRIGAQRGEGQSRREQSMRSMEDQIDDDYLKRYDFGHHVSPLPRNDRPYFSAPRSHRPMKFNYNRIFGTSDTNPCSPLDVNEEASAKEMWSETVKTWDQKLEEEKLKTEEPSYNPRDKRLMESMLIDALNQMKEDPKFVLATMPDCHKIPVLREWIKSRYGFIYTRKEKLQSFKKSRRVFFELKKHTLPIPLPRLSQLGTKRFVSYNYRDCVLRKSQRLIDEYHKNCKVSLMESIRAFWGASQPHQCSGGPPRSVFFAYMPSKFSDIFLFRPYSSWINLSSMLEVITKKKSAK